MVGQGISTCACSCTCASRCTLRSVAFQSKEENENEAGADGRKAAGM